MCCAGTCPLCKIPGGRKVADRIYDIGIVGGGPAGLTAALYARRAGRSVFLAEEALPGGQITASPAVENYPGVRSMDGIAYAACLREQVRALGVEPTAVRVERVCDEGKHKLLLSADGGQRCRALILATGSRYRRLSLPGEEELTGHGLSYCATCDGAFFRDRRVAVCGGGNSALTEALFLSDLCAEVFLIHRRDRFRGETYLLERLDEQQPMEPTKPAPAYYGFDFAPLREFDRSNLPADVRVDPGSFTATDDDLQSVPLDDEERNTPQFPYNWKKAAGDEPFVMELTCSALQLLFKDSGLPEFGAAEVTVDGRTVGRYDPRQAGWTHCHATILFKDQSAALHRVEIRMDPNEKDKTFTILGFGVVR